MTLVSDIEYADDMALVTDNWDDILVVLPNSTHQQPEPLSLHPDQDTVEVVFQYLGSIVADDCTTDAEVALRISKASQAFFSLNPVLWYQKKVETVTKLRIFNLVVMPTLLDGLESAVLLEHQVHLLQSFVMHCL